MALTPRQRRFVAEYLISLNASQAAVRAGYSAKTARAAGSRLLTFVDVQAAIEKRQAVPLEQANLSAMRVLEEYRRVAFSDVGDYFDDVGRLKPLHDMPTDARAALASVKTTKHHRTAGDGIMEDVVEIRLFPQRHVPARVWGDRWRIGAPGGPSRADYLLGSTPGRSVVAPDEVGRSSGLIGTESAGTGHH
jgi:phage terminase small subunit